MSKVRIVSTVIIATTISGILLASEPDDKYRRVDDIQYAEVDGQRLLLDLYLPADVVNPPVVVWVHGGAWRRGSKSNMPLADLVKHGFAVASVDYRLSPVAKFPAQIHDCKAAIRYLRGNSAKYGINAERIGVAGSSAGGHLAALIGVTNHHKGLEGELGDHRDQSSSVQATVDYFGPTNFMTILQQSTPHGLSVRVPALELLLGDAPEKEPKLSRLASPVFHVGPDDPPLLLIHGDQDPQVPINQSHELHSKYKNHRLSVHFEVVHGGAHGGDAFFDSRRTELVRDFFRQHLAKQSDGTR